MKYKFIGTVNYILVGHEPVPEPDLLKWAKAFGHDDRVVAQDWVNGEVWVSTVFLGIDHNFACKGPPVLFETMVFGNHKDEELDIVRRYCTWDQAEAGHKETLEEVRKYLEKAKA